MPRWFIRAGVLATLCAAAPGLADELATADVEQALESCEARLAALEAQLAETSSPCLSSSVCCDACDQPATGWHGGAALVLAKPHFKEAFQLSVIDPATATQSLYPFSYDYAPAPRVWLGYTGADGLGLRSEYWQYDQAGDSRSIAPSMTPSGPTIASAHAVTVIFPAAIAALPGQTLVASDGLEVHALDLEGTIRRDIGQTSILLGGGLRYASVDQSLASAVRNHAGASVSQLVWRRRFDGIGPLLHIDVRKRLGDTGFSVVGQGNGALAFGDKRLQRQLVGGVTLPGQAPSTPDLRLDDADEVVGLGEVRFGLEYACDLAAQGRFFLLGAYEAQLWAEGGAPTLGFLGFEGFSVSVGVRR